MTPPVATPATVRAVAVGQVVRFEHGPRHVVVGRVDAGHPVNGGVKLLIRGTWWFLSEGHDIDVLHPLAANP